MTSDDKSSLFRRVIIENVRPAVDHGQYPAKRIQGDMVTIEADIYADGHDDLRAMLLWKKEGAEHWRESPMTALPNDLWRCFLRLEEVGRYQFTILAWVDEFETWRGQLRKRTQAGQDVTVDLMIGAGILRKAAVGAHGKTSRQITNWAAALVDDKPIETRISGALSEELSGLMNTHGQREFPTKYFRDLAIVVDPPQARFSAWYEMFPRSAAERPDRHGTFADMEKRLPYIAGMGFDVLYLPPIHPIGATLRKGKNNTTQPEPGAIGSPWGIGGAEGGHKAIHPELGGLEDFKRLVESARRQGISLALDIAFQVSPDHPYVASHPEWFRKRPDGTVQYAENPPKKYQDIFPFDFSTPSAMELWQELKSVFDYWIGQGVTIFRVDNPHTKPFAFWEWVIPQIKKEHPETIFLAEAFTRPKIMYHLAKIGFTQSYTYFPWRNGKTEIMEYMTELAHTPVRDFFRPNHWTNTPDILTAFLQSGGRPAFFIRFILASTLGANYGIYGPAFELLENRPLHEGSEEYLDSEKYQLRSWDLDRQDSLREVISKVNQIRRANPALHSDWTTCFHETDNSHLICYSRTAPQEGNVILVLVNLDPHNTQIGWTNLNMPRLGLDGAGEFEALDLLTNQSYIWNGPRNYVELRPGAPAHIFLIHRHGYTPNFSQTDYGNIS